MEKLTKILILDQRAEKYKSLIAPVFPQLTFYTAQNESQAVEYLGDVQGLFALGHMYTDSLVEKAHKLQWIQALTTGTDAILTLRNLSKDVVVTSTRGIHGPQMSEMAFLHMLNLTRQYPRMLRNQDKGVWERWPQSLLFQKTVGIVGVGVIAEQLAPRCKAFGMTVYGVSSVQRPVDGFDKIFLREQLSQVAGLVDYLVLIVPYSADTHHLISRKVLQAMKPTGFLINVARGGVVDEVALIEALNENVIAAAGLDVFETEPLPKEHPFWSMENVFITPKLGGMSDIYQQQVQPILEHNIRAFLADKTHEMLNVIEH
ncbi:D-2-hydroxyacid dehydrogenase [Pseudomonadota bacterium]